MSQFESSPNLNRSARRRTRSPSPHDQLRPRKRQRRGRHRFSPPLLVNRPLSASSIATSIGQYYGVGDEDGLGNLFASYPETFTTAPRPHGSRGLHEPPWELRFDHEVHLSNDFPSGGRQSLRVRIPIPGPETDPLSCSPLQSAQQQQSSPTRAEFQSALKLVRQYQEGP
jgi:hypothetical protein